MVLTVSFSFSLLTANSVVLASFYCVYSSITSLLWLLLLSAVLLSSLLNIIMFTISQHVRSHYCWLNTTFLQLSPSPCLSRRCFFKEFFLNISKIFLWLVAIIVIVLCFLNIFYYIQESILLSSFLSCECLSYYFFLLTLSNKSFNNYNRHSR